MELAKYIDHTLLKADASVEDIIKLCNQAQRFGFASVCINPCYVALAANRLAGTDVKVCTVVGFPLGANIPIVKAYEARMAVLDKADEIDMVMNIGAAKAGYWDVVRRDIDQVIEVVQGKIVKVIIETSLLTDEEKLKACDTIVEAKAHFVKTSTGFSNQGATVSDVKLIKDYVKDLIQIKASGGIRTREQALALIEAGATRIGTSAGIDMLQ